MRCQSFGLSDNFESILLLAGEAKNSPGLDIVFPPFFQITFTS